MNNLIKRQSSGFTIVELLIVIVVIGILAAITIVAYTGITTQANANAAKSNAQSVLDAANSASTLAGGTYPALSGATFTVTQNGITVASPSGLTMQGTALNGASSNTTIVYVRNTANTGVCIAVKPVGSTEQVIYGGTATTIGTYLTGTAAVTCT